MTSACCAPGLERRVADRLPRAPGPGRRHDHAGRDDHAGPDRGARAHGPGDERHRRADAARAGARPGPRRPASSRTCRWRWIFFVNLPIGVDRPRARRPAACRGSAPSGGAAKDAPTAPRLEGAAAPVARPRARRVRPERGLDARRRHARAAAAGDRAGIALIAAFVVPRVDGASRRSSTCGCSAAAGFAAAAATVFLVGGALFGALLVLPLYYQVGRGESPLHGRPAHGAAGRRRGARR